MMMQGGEGGSLLWMLIMSVIVVVPFWRICAKAGYSSWLSLLILIPLANLGLLYFLAFAEWPVRKRGTVGTEGQ